MENYNYDTLQEIVKEFKLKIYDKDEPDESVYIDFPLDEVNGCSHYVGIRNIESYTHQGKVYYKPEPVVIRKERGWKDYDYFSFYWNDTNKYFKMSWPKVEDFVTLRDYIIRLKAYAETIKKNHNLNIKKSVVKEKIFGINEENTFGCFNELAEKLEKNGVKVKWSSQPVNGLYTFGDFTFKNRPKLKCWDVSIPKNRDYFWRVTEFKDVYKVCEWWYSKPSVNWEYGKVK